MPISATAASRGFTLIEILVVMVILATLSVGVGLSLHLADPQRAGRQREAWRERIEQDLAEVRHGQRHLTLFQRKNGLDARFDSHADVTNTPLPPPPEPLRWLSADINARSLAPEETLELGAETFPLLTLVAAGPGDCRVRLTSDPLGRVALHSELCP